MKKQIVRRTSGYLLSAAVAAAIAAPASAYNLYSQDGSELNLDIEAVFGVFSSEENYLLDGDTGGADWREGYIKYGLSGSHAYAESGASVYAGLNLISSATWGDGDAGGFTSGNESETDLEDAYVGWRSGNLIPALGQDGLDISFGRQQFAIGDGFLINGDSLNAGQGISDVLGEDLDRGGAYWLAARKAFDRTAIVRLGGSEGLRGDLFWLESDNRIQAEMELAGINVEYVMPEGTIGATYIEGLEVNDQLANLLDYTYRDGQQTVSLRYQGNAGVENLFLSGEFVTQDQGDATGTDADAWYVEAGWTFADLPWSPSVNYRYSTFDAGFDPLFFGFSRGYGTWFQGEVAANYAGPFNSAADVHHIGIKASPTEMLSIGALFFDFSDAANPFTGDAGGVNGQEIDLYAEWVVTPNLIVSPLIGFYSPDNSAANGGTQVGNDDTNVYAQMIAIVPF
ncbi:alginate export family protein [Marinobacterium sediminicola]|uniref:Alginate export n=1 Tax=Marinobacterium sediminicola TaxID=518898 RepID=A0ABY1RZ52_9GAMM|nr:alginate export family protein [Marinobacterium sediminicola]ULG68031.1 alginate export family protein [Marinobacterium sediminicola]SMR73459.1 Alginate export [Marinobacterium sediminicola]